MGDIRAEEAVELRGHVIVAGLHGIGLRVVEQLVAIGQEVVVLDDDPDDRSLRLVQQWGVTALAANPRRREALIRAGIAAAAAIVCLDSNDLHSLETALIARELDASVRVVVRSSNRAVAQALAAVAQPGAVLDAAALAAPAFVDAVLDRSTHDFEIAGVRFQVLTVRPARPATLRAAYGDLVPVAVASPRMALQLCPGRDVGIEPGDSVTVLGTLEELQDNGLTRNEKAAPRALVPVGGRFPHEGRNGAHSGSLRALWHSMTYGADRALKITLCVVVAVTILATIVIDIGYEGYGQRQMDWLDSLYVTVQTLVTVGYGDFPFGDQPTYLRVFDIALMLIGAALIAILFAQLTDLLVSRRIAASFGSQRASSMNGHIVLIGLGSVGTRVLEQLVHEGKKVAVIDSDPHPRYLSQARARDVPVVVADATDPQSLLAVNAQSAAAIAVLTNDDLANIETALVIREQLGAEREVPTVLRLFDRQLSATVERSFGFHHVRSTAALAAPWFVAAALGLDVRSSFTVENETMLIGMLTVTSEGGLDGVLMRDLDARIRVVAIERAADPARLEHPPRRDTSFTAGDQAYVVGPHEDLLQVLRRNRSPM